MGFDSHVHPPAEARGIHSYIYFQPTESWEFFANSHFPECILHHADGRPVTTWYDHVVMDCRPETTWGKYLCRQLEQVFDALPEVDGVFMDQSAGDRYDYSVCRITDKLARIAEARGKLLYWNGPYQVELIEHAVGMLAEGGSLQGEMIKYLTIGNKVCCGMGTSERQYQRNLLNGLWPSAPSLVHEQASRYDDEPVTLLKLPPELTDIHRRYMYLYELYPGKVWYLGAHALATPAGVQANIFQRPDGDYLVPLIVPERTLHSAIKTAAVHLKVRIPDAGKIRGVYADAAYAGTAIRRCLDPIGRDGGDHAALARFGLPAVDCQDRTSRRACAGRAASGSEGAAGRGEPHHQRRH